VSLKRILSQARSASDSDLLVTPRLDEWLSRNGNIEPSQETIDRVLQAELGTPQRDRTMTFSASSRGACRRQQVFWFTDVKPVSPLNADLHAIFHDGTFRHMRWQMWLLEAGILDDVEVFQKYDQLWLTGTIDGIGTIPPELADRLGMIRDAKFGWELKGANSHKYRFVLDQGPDIAHLLQIHAYFVARPDIDVWSLCYENKDTQEWKEFVVRPDPKLMKEVEAEIHDLQGYVLNEELPPVLDECKKRQGPFKTCPFAHACLSTYDWPREQRKIRKKR